MDNKKPYLSPEDLIRKMKQKGITISNEAYVENCLLEVSFNKIYTPYKKVFGLKKDENQCHIYNGKCFSDFEVLYLLDKECSNMCLGELINIETKIKNILIESLANKYILGKLVGEEFCCVNFFNYIYKNSDKGVAKKKQLRNMMVQWFALNTTNGRDIVQITLHGDEFIRLNDLEGKIIEFKDFQLQHHYDQYGCIPMWLFIHRMTMGNITTLTSFLHSSDVATIKQMIGYKGRKIETLFNRVQKYRNVLAHNFTIATMMDTRIRADERCLDSFEEVFLISESSKDNYTKKITHILEMNEFIGIVSTVPNSGTILNEMIHKYKIN